LSPLLRFLFYLVFMMSGLMSDPNENYQQPEDESLEFWMWCEEQSELHADDDDDDESIEIEIIPEDLPF
tara:strand:+ start:375 stop:581 length:207 start_codon:yes stop_codon:yes gene_type:complete